jgi:hypothetical protein
MRSHAVGLASAVAMLVCSAGANLAVAQTQVSAQCMKRTDAELLYASTSPGARSYLSGSLKVLPGGTVISVEFPGQLRDGMVFCARLLEPGASRAPALQAADVTGRVAGPDPRAASKERRDVEVMAIRQIKTGDGTALVSLDLRLPAVVSFGPQQERDLVVASFDLREGLLHESSPGILVWQAFWVSSGPFAFAVAALVVIGFYTIAVLIQGKGAEKAGKTRRSLSPVFVTSNKFGRASLSQLQIFAFTLIIVGMLTFVLLRTSVLSDISADILMLLGISAAGTAGAKIAEVLKGRLKFEHWSWLRNQGWLTAYEDSTAQEQKPPLAKAAWPDLLKSDGSFDIYSFQLAAVSLLVAVALLTSDLSGLAQFRIPEHLLQLLGLSNVVFVGAKAIQPDTFKDLDEKLEEVIQAEMALKAKLGTALTADERKDSRRALEKARTTAKPELDDYLEKAKIAARMLTSIFPEKGDTKFDGSISDETVMPRFA